MYSSHNSNIKCVDSTQALCSIYPSLFNLALNKEVTVANMWDSGKGKGC